MIPGEIRVRPEPVEINTGRRSSLIVTIENTGDRPVQIGSHLHLPDANERLTFEPAPPAGHRLDIPAGTAIRLEPGASRELVVIPLGGAKRVPGLQPRPRAGAEDVDEGETR